MCNTTSCCALRHGTYINISMNNSCFSCVESSDLNLQYTLPITIYSVNSSLNNNNIIMNTINHPPICIHMHTDFDQI